MRTYLIHPIGTDINYPEITIQYLHLSATLENTVFKKKYCICCKLYPEISISNKIG